MTPADPDLLDAAAAEVAALAGRCWRLAWQHLRVESADMTGRPVSWRPSDIARLRSEALCDGSTWPPGCFVPAGVVARSLHVPTVIAERTAALTAWRVAPTSVAVDGGMVQPARHVRSGGAGLPSWTMFVPGAGDRSTVWGGFVWSAGPGPWQVYPAGESTVSSAESTGLVELLEWVLDGPVIEVVVSGDDVVVPHTVLAVGFSTA